MSKMSADKDKCIFDRTACAKAGSCEIAESTEDLVRYTVLFCLGRNTEGIL